MNDFLGKLLDRMTFLNATLIFGISAVAVPIVLHLIARREPRKVVFPSIRFLTKRYESNRSRLQIRRWWLLALRIAALAALAIALARPAIHHSLSLTWLTISMVVLLGAALLVMATVSLARGHSTTTTYALGISGACVLLASLIWGARTYASGPVPVTDSIEPVSIAIVLDNSPTSAWKTANDDRIGRMKDLATWMVTRLPRTSRIAIVDRSGQLASFSLDVSSAVSKIEQLRPLEVTQPITTRLEAAIRLVRTSDLPNRQVLLITDLADSTWDDSSTEAGIATVLGEGPPVALTLFDLGDFDGVNRSLANPRFADATPPRGVPIPVTTTLELNANNSNTVSVTAELELYQNDPSLPVVRDGVVRRPQAKSVDRTSVRIAPGGSSELLLTIPALDVGTHHGRVRLVGDDSVRLDDAKYFTIQVLQPAKILLVSDDPEGARIISRTITAAPGLIDDGNAEFKIDRVDFADLSVVRLSDFDALILLDPPRDILGDGGVIEFANQGGGVFVCLGPSAGEATLDASLIPNLVRRWRSPEPGTFFQVSGTTHPVTQPLSRGTPWNDFRIHQYWQVDATERDTVLIEYAGTSHAALVERRLGQGDQPGRVLLLTTPIPALTRPTRSWNDLFGTDPWPAWLLTRQSVEYLTRRGGADLMSMVGQPQVIQLDAESDSEPQRIQLFPPGDAAPIPLNVPEGARRVVASDVSRSGTYWLRGLGEGAGFTANLPEDAIRLEKIDPGKLDLIFGPDRYTLATDREGIEFAENKATHRISLHSPAILMVFLMFLLEQILGNRFYR